MRRIWSVVSSTVRNPWIVAGVLAVMAASPAAAETTTFSSFAAASHLAPLPPAAIGVNPGLAAGESAPLGLGALVGAVIAFGAALRERFKDR